MLKAKKARYDMKVRAFDKVLGMEHQHNADEDQREGQSTRNTTNPPQEQNAHVAAAHHHDDNVSSLPFQIGPESTFQERIAQLHEEKLSLQHQLREYLAQEENSSQMDSSPTDYYTQLNAYAAEHSNLRDQYLGLNAKKSHLMIQLAKLVPAHVLNEAFTINCDGLFGTINGMRLGRLNIDHVDWIEVNSAFGHITLLLYSISQYKHFYFDKISILPKGAFSRIVKGSSTYDLVGGAGFTGFFWKKKFDHALRGLLDALHQLCSEAERDLKETRPYPISGDTIGGFSIKYVEKMEDKWTNALKCFLVNAKFLLVWVCSET